MGRLKEATGERGLSGFFCQFSKKGADFEGAAESSKGWANIRWDASSVNYLDGCFLFREVQARQSEDQWREPRANARLAAKRVSSILHCWRRVLWVLARP